MERKYSVTKQRYRITLRDHRMMGNPGVTDYECNLRELAEILGRYIPDSTGFVGRGYEDEFDILKIEVLGK